MSTIVSCVCLLRTVYKHCNTLVLTTSIDSYCTYSHDPNVLQPGQASLMKPWLSSWLQRCTLLKQACKVSLAWYFFCSCPVAFQAVQWPVRIALRRHISCQMHCRIVLVSHSQGPYSYAACHISGVCYGHVKVYCSNPMSSVISVCSACGSLGY